MRNAPPRSSITSVAVDLHFGQGFFSGIGVTLAVPIFMVFEQKVYRIYSGRSVFNCYLLAGLNNDCADVCC